MSKSEYESYLEKIPYDARGDTEVEVELRILRLQALLEIRQQITVKTLRQERTLCEFIKRSNL